MNDDTQDIWVDEDKKLLDGLAVPSATFAWDPLSDAYVQRTVTTGSGR